MLEAEDFAWTPPQFSEKHKHKHKQETWKWKSNDCQQSLTP